MKLLSHNNIGRLRRMLMLPGSWRWNAWVWDVTAHLG
jgi:hypothetical protein